VSRPVFTSLGLGLGLGLGEASLESKSAVCIAKIVLYGCTESKDVQAVEYDEFCA